MNPVNAYILKQPKENQILITLFHTLFTETYGLKSYIKWSIPTYFGNKHLFYLNPDKKEGVHLCFMAGQKLSNKHGILQPLGRKIVLSYHLKNIDDMPYELLIEAIEELIAIDRSEIIKKQQKQNLWN